MKNYKPIIGVTPSENAGESLAQIPAAYLEALQESRAIPLLLPLYAAAGDCRRLARTLDGILFTGGPDVHPAYFKEETLEGCGGCSPARDRLEFFLFAGFFHQKKPILAVCRGIQLVNIALGGDIWQDIGQMENRLPIAHRQPFAAAIPSHHVSLAPGSRLAAIAGAERLHVNSAHHQALRRVAPSLRICATAPDGVIEAVEAPDYPFLLGVQWHPELLFHSQSHARRLFGAFVESCRKERQT